MTDCAVCHGPERSPRSLYRVLPSDRAITLAFAWEEGLATGEREDFEAAVREALDETPVLLVDDGLVVRVAVGVSVEPGRTDRGAPFHAARARARVRLHRAEVKLVSRPGVDSDAATARREALGHLVPEVVLTLTW